MLMPLPKLSSEISASTSTHTCLAIVLNAGALLHACSRHSLTPTQELSCSLQVHQCEPRAWRNMTHKPRPLGLPENKALAANRSARRARGTGAAKFIACFGISRQEGSGAGPKRTSYRPGKVTERRCGEELGAIIHFGTRSQHHRGLERLQRSGAPSKGTPCKLTQAQPGLPRTLLQAQLPGALLHGLAKAVGRSGLLLLLLL